MGKIEYLNLNLTRVIQDYINSSLTKKDWCVVAIDVTNDRLILRRVTPILEEIIEGAKNIA